MKILVINQFGRKEVKDSDFLPRVGDKVDMFQNPLPTVFEVVCWPSKEQIKDFGFEFDAIIRVS